MSQKSVLIKESILTNKVFLDNKEATIAAGNLLLHTSEMVLQYHMECLKGLNTSIIQEYL